MASSIKFYKELLGLTLVKQSVNPDDPYTPLWIFGDRLGTPGTQIHLLFYPRSSKAEEGAGTVQSIGLRIPRNTSTFWGERLKRFRTESGEYRDPDGLLLRLLESDSVKGWQYDERSGVPERFAIRGLHSVALLVSVEGERFWQERGFPGVKRKPAESEGQLGYGGVHHLAFCTYRRDLKHDRQYCRSSYEYTPDGLLCEYATEGPGPTLDEWPERLGERLCLPSWYEERREEIESVIRSMK
jgi:catechol 2,3-dioxygenase-like lactoylglutathione lyase family enzyme